MEVTWSGLRTGSLLVEGEEKVVPFMFEEVQGFLSCLFDGGKRVSQKTNRSFESHATEELERFAIEGFCATMSMHYPD